jgi:hypothetical protein
LIKIFLGEIEALRAQAINAQYYAFIVKKLSNQYPNQYQNGKDLPTKVSPVDYYDVDLPF